MHVRSRGPNGWLRLIPPACSGRHNEAGPFTRPLRQEWPCPSAALLRHQPHLTRLPGHLPGRTHVLVRTVPPCEVQGTAAPPPTPPVRPDPLHRHSAMCQPAMFNHDPRRDPADCAATAGPQGRTKALPLTGHEEARPLFLEPRCQHVSCSLPLRLLALAPLCAALRWWPRPHTYLKRFRHLSMGIWPASRRRDEPSQLDRRSCPAPAPPGPAGSGSVPGRWGASRGTPRSAAGARDILL